MNVVITGSRAPVALDLGRRFHKAGHSVYQVDSLPYGMAMHSRATKQSFVVPRPAEDLHGFTATLQGIVSKHSIDLIIPTCEEVYFLAACADQIPCRVLCDSLDQLRSLHNKWEFSQLVESGSSPETRLLKSLDDVNVPRRELADWVFKPVYSRFASRTLIGPTEAEVETIDANDDQWVMQRRVHGTEYSTWSFAEAGDLKAHTAYRSLYRAGSGSGIYFVPIIHEGIFDFVKRFVKQRDFTGQIGFDLIQEPSGRLFVLEANPRATSGLHMFSQSDPLVNLLLGQSNGVCHPSSERPVMVEFAMPLWGFVDAVQRGRVVNFVPDLLRSRWVVTELSDPMPMLGLPRSFWQIARVAREKGCSLQTASTFDIEWNGEPL